MTSTTRNCNCMMELLSLKWTLLKVDFKRSPPEGVQHLWMLGKGVVILGNSKYYQLAKHYMFHRSSLMYMKNSDSSSHGTKLWHSQLKEARVYTFDRENKQLVELRSEDLTIRTLTERMKALRNGDITRTNSLVKDPTVVFFFINFGDRSINKEAYLMSVKTGFQCDQPKEAYYSAVRIRCLAMITKQIKEAAYANLNHKFL
ncbi:hypothetical protein HAX54_007890 [Datura stramonium]|uniref:Uncharacterized protein n=1 Tax=Datura stramonium TaxID=4076 RepID=A0ABS8TF00_DATST|nr:hypothetical protein [Datura stramonium]